MSQQELNRIIYSNTGLHWDNKNKKVQNQILRITSEIEYQTMKSKIAIALNDAINSGLNVEANKLSLALNRLEKESSTKWYEVKKRFDNDNYKWWNKPFKLLDDAVYLYMFDPSNRSMRGINMPNLPNNPTYNTHNTIKNLK